MELQDIKNLILEDRLEQNVANLRPPLHLFDRYDFWGKRYLLIHGFHDELFWHFYVFDLLMNDLRAVRFRKPDTRVRLGKTHYLNKKFMLFVGKMEKVTCVYLVKINWESNEFETVEKSELKLNNFRIFVDPFDSKKFVALFGRNAYQDCKLVGGKLWYGNTERFSHNEFSFYSQDKLIGVSFSRRQFKIKVYDMTNRKQREFWITTLPENVELCQQSTKKQAKKRKRNKENHYDLESRRPDYYQLAWISERLYVPVRFQKSDFRSGNYGILWTDLKTFRWTELNVEIDVKIHYLHFYEDTLILHAKKLKALNRIDTSAAKSYGFPIRRPQHLRNLALLSVVRKMKRQHEIKPYEAARKYVSPTSDLHSVWFQDDEEAKEMEQKVEALNQYMAKVDMARVNMESD